MIKTLSTALLIFFFTSLVSADHPIGEPELERSEIWRICCERDDCVPQPVEILRSAGKTVMIVIEGYTVVLSVDKFHPAPTHLQWVCYFDVNGNLESDNIRCILFPRKFLAT